MEPNQTVENKTSRSKFLKWSIIIGIIIVLNLFFNYTLTLVYKAPEYESYYTRPQVVEAPTNKEDCLSIGGQWTENPTYLQQLKTGDKTAQVGYCDPEYTTRLNYENARKVYERNVFITLIVLGIISLISGIIISFEILSTSFAWGGVLSLIIASMRYWSLADNLLKVIILGVALAALIWVSVKKFK